MANGAADAEGCRGASGRRITVDNAFVGGYCMGIVEATMWSLPGTGVVCLPKGVTTGQGLKVLVKYLDDHPEELHERTVQLAARLPLEVLKEKK
jgi:hypothetical protein